MKAKEDIKAGTISHCFCVGTAEAQVKDGFRDDQAVSLKASLHILPRLVEDVDMAFSGVYFRHTTRSGIRHNFEHSIRIRAGDATLS